jgi:gluconolactonase
MTVDIDTGRAALIIQDMQNDAIAEGGAFADSGSPHHAAEQNVVDNCRRLARACRAAGVPVIHVWFVVEDGATGLKLNAPLFTGVQENHALVRGSWGAEPVPGLERQPGDLLVEKMRMSALQDTILESLIRGLDRDQVIVSGAWTNMLIEHTARSGADKGYFMFVPEDCCSTMNADRHNASINYALQNVSTVTNCDAVVAAIGG